MPGGGLSAHQDGPHRAARRIQALLRHHAAEMQGVRGRAHEHRGLEAVDHHGPHLGRHAAAGNAGDLHLGDGELDTPGEDVRAVAGANEQAVGRTDSEGVERAGIGPGPELAVELRVAEHPRDAGRARGREEHPPAFGPQGVVMRGVGAVRRMGLHVRHHLGLVDDRPLGEIVHGPDVRRKEAETIEARPVEGAVLVEKGRERRKLGILDGDELVAARAVQGGRPVVL